MSRISRFLQRKSALVRVRVADLAGASELPGVIATIAPGDGMYLGDLSAYLKVGYSALRCVQLALLAAEKEDVGRILDFGCGHGRVLRVLRAAYPRARLTACDINQRGVDFCARTFGATPVYSGERPEAIDLPDKYDLIWCGSVFTHLSEARWPGFLNLLVSHLDERGVALITTHGRTVARRMRADGRSYGLDDAESAEIFRGYESTGFGYVNQASGGLECWGLSLTSPSRVLAQVERFPGVEILSYSEHAWSSHQDVVAVVKSGPDSDCAVPKDKAPGP